MLINHGEGMQGVVMFVLFSSSVYVENFCFISSSGSYRRAQMKIIVPFETSAGQIFLQNYFNFPVNSCSSANAFPEIMCKYFENFAASREVLVQQEC